MTENGIVKSPDVLRENRIPPGQRLTASWPVLHYGSLPQIDIDSWAFRIFGLVQNNLELDCKKFSDLPFIGVLSDIHCVTGWSKLDNIWEGPAATTVYELASVLPSARYVMIHAAGDFSTNLSLDDFLQSDVIFALRHDGINLSPQHGYPVRLVVPRLYFWKSAKWVTGLEFSAQDRNGFWESRGYHNRGDPWKEERYSQ